MRAAIFNKPGSITVGERPDASLVERTDAVVGVVRACACGSDLWYYRGDSPYEAGDPIGHEFIGVVEQVGRDVRDLAVGDFVVSPFAYSDNTCPNCQRGAQTAYLHGGFIPAGNHDGGQAEAVRVPWADGTLVKVPGSDHSDETLASLVALTDVMGTGYHAAVCARVGKGDTVAVVGDGGVGLCGVIAANELGAERIIALSRHANRQALAREFGATDVIASRGDEAVAAVKELTGDIGVDATLECFGTKQSMDTALAIARPLSMIAYVGLPHGVEFPPRSCSGATSGCKADLRQSAPTCLGCSMRFSRVRSTQTASSTSRPTSTTSPRHMRPWTSGGQSSRSYLSAIRNAARSKHATHRATNN